MLPDLDVSLVIVLFSTYVEDALYRPHSVVLDWDMPVESLEL